MSDAKAYLDEENLSFLWSRIKDYVAKHSGSGEVGEVNWDDILNKPDLALKTDIPTIEPISLETIDRITSS